MDKYIGKRLEGRYEILELIGMGGMANVYKAHDVIDDRVVAVKILRDEFLGNSEFLRRFKNESKAISVLSHPNIVRVFDVSFTNRVHSIVMEYIDGITLKDYIERQGALSSEESVHFTLQILRALQHAHDKGIVHRDIKPHNIMLLQNGTIKVTDFGIARFARSEVKTITDRAIGSVHYISPEQAMGEATDEKTDIYSVGVMLFEMLTGRLPFEADTAVSVAIKQIQTQAVKPSSLNPSIPSGLEDITMRAMQKDAAYRYQSAAEMIADLEKFKEDPSIRFSYKFADSGGFGGRKKNRKQLSEPGDDDDMPKRRKTPYIPILTGVTLAFVLAASGFIFLMVWLNNPFAQTPEDVVPDLLGRTVADLVADAEVNIYEIVEEDGDYNDIYAKGQIYQQRPTPTDPKIKAGSTIKVWVSKGPKLVVLADYSGQNANMVMQKLREDGLDPKEVKEYSTDVPSGNVMYTDPPVGKELNSGSSVTVYVSMGQKQTLVEVPAVIIGMKVDEARRYLEFQRLQIGSVSEQVSDKPEGTIIAVSPDIGTMQPEDTIISVVVAKKAPKSFPITIPLPPMMEPITIRARAEDNSVIAQAQLDPRRDDYWSFDVDGEGEIIINVYISTETMGGKLYRRYIYNFETHELRLETDNAGSGYFG